MKDIFQWVIVMLLVFSMCFNLYLLHGAINYQFDVCSKCYGVVGTNSIPWCSCPVDED